MDLAAESGINLMSPSDSGLSLEEEPLDLAGTGISGLDLGAEIAGGSGSQFWRWQWHKRLALVHSSIFPTAKSFN